MIKGGVYQTVNPGFLSTNRTPANHVTCDFCTVCKNVRAQKDKKKKASRTRSVLRCRLICSHQLFRWRRLISPHRKYKTFHFPATHTHTHDSDVYTHLRGHVRRVTLATRNTDGSILRRAAWVYVAPRNTRLMYSRTSMLFTEALTWYMHCMYLAETIKWTNKCLMIFYSRAL